MRLFLVVAIIFVSLIARDNPFKPAISSQKIGKATNVGSGLKPLKLETFKLPSSSRVIKSVKLEILNVDGSTNELKYNIEKKIDWHNPLYLSNSKLKIEENSKKLKPKPKEISVFKFLTIFIDGKKMFVKTKDSLIRELYFSKPYKIVLDLKRKVAFYTKFIKIDKPPLKKIVIGNHSQFYRVVIWLDGEYKYTLDKKNNGYLIKLF